MRRSGLPDRLRTPRVRCPKCQHATRVRFSRDSYDETGAIVVRFRVCTRKLCGKRFRTISPPLPIERFAGWDSAA